MMTPAILVLLGLALLGLWSLFSRPDYGRSVELDDPEPRPWEMPVRTPPPGACYEEVSEYHRIKSLNRLAWLDSPEFDEWFEKWGSQYLHDLYEEKNLTLPCGHGCERGC